jgi:hypothetical protein
MVNDPVLRTRKACIYILYCDAISERRVVCYFIVDPDNLIYFVVCCHL